MERATDLLKRNYIRDAVTLFIKTLELGEEEKILPKQLEVLPHPRYQTILLSKAFYLLPPSHNARQAIIHTWLKAKKSFDELNRSIFRATKHDLEKAIREINEYKPIDEWWTQAVWAHKCLIDIRNEGERNNYFQIVHQAIMEHLGPMDGGEPADETVLGVAF